MVEPLIRWLKASGKGYDIASCGLNLASKWYADDGTLITNSVEDMTSPWTSSNNLALGRATSSPLHLSPRKDMLGYTKPTHNGLERTGSPRISFTSLPVTTQGQSP
jgi:hypothetical protein